jgi:hypothetical protein
MAGFDIPDDIVQSVARQIHVRTTRDYKIPVVGTAENIETPQVFEIMPFDEIDKSVARVYAIDGSRASHSFYNGATMCFYQAGYVCFHHGRECRLNAGSDPIYLGQVFHGSKMLVFAEADLVGIYDEFLALEPVARMIDFFGEPPTDIFPYDKEVVTRSVSTLLSFCQEVVEWACVLHILEKQPCELGDFILRDGTLRSLNIKQRFLVKLGHLAHIRGVRIVAVTKQSPIKTELAYTLSKVDSYLQSKLKPTYRFRASDPKRQKLCCYFEVRDDILDAAYAGGGSGMYSKKDIVGGRGFGLFFASRLDYVEKLQNYDWLICDLNIYDCIPGIANKNLNRDADTVRQIMYDLTAFTQEHYILGYPYPLVEVHNLVTLTDDFKKQAIAKVKNALYGSQHMDHTDIENLFLDIHSRF